MDQKSNYLYAFAYRKIIVDKEGNPTDYEFIEVNKAFKRLFTSDEATMIGKTPRDIIPDNSENPFDWISFYGEVALSGKTASIERYSEALDRWYSVEVYSQEKGYFATILIDITSFKQKELELIEKNNQLGQLYEEIAAAQEELRQQMEELDQTNKLLKESESRLKRAQALAHVGNWELNLDTKIVWASEEAFNLYGIEMESHVLSLQLVQQVVHPEDRSKLDEALDRLLKGEAEYNINFRVISVNNSEIRYMHSLAEVEYDSAGKPIRILGVIQDVTASVLNELELYGKNRELTTLYEELTGSEEELRQQFDEINSNKATIEISEERYKTLVNNSQDAIYSVDCQGVFTTANSRFCELVGLPIDRILGKTVADIYKKAENIEKWNTLLPKVIEGGKVVFLENKRVRNDGSVDYLEVTLSPIFDLRQKVVGVIGTNHDITTRKENEQTIKHMAYYDLITDLPNRILFLNRLEMSISKAAKNGTKVMIVFLDLDNFKAVNDTLGHATGDELLVETSKRLLRCIDENNMVARLGGDEFSFLIDQVKQQEGIVALLKRVKSSFVESFRINDHTINLTASIGISMFPEDGDSAEEIMKSADTAMYKAKEIGKNDYQFFNMRMKEDLVRKTTISKLLRNAILHNEFVLHYQPQYIVETGELRGFEALLRWNSSEMGFLNPMEFIPIAEETGLIIQIGEWVLNTACCTCKKFETIYGCELVMAVNISPIQLRQKDFREMVMKALKTTGLKAHSLELEITEGIFIDSYDSIVDELRVLKKLGVKTALDDFGTGYSSLSYLKRLPINLLKIDKSFVQEIDFLNLDDELMESIIALVSKLNIKTIAEGVETLAQFNYLVSVKCDYLQGYFLGKPTPEDLIGGIIERGCLKEFLHLPR